MKQEKRVPKRRFRAFAEAGEWNEAKLGDVATFAKGIGYSKDDLVSKGTPVILYGRMYTDYETVIDAVDTYVEPLHGSLYSTGREVIVPASGETAEDISIASAVRQPDVLLGGDLNVISPDDAYDPTFLALFLSRGKAKQELSRKAQGKTIVHLHGGDLSDVDVVAPTLEEQQQIGMFCCKLDELITSHERKLQKLAHLKHAYLAEMFPSKGERQPRRRFKGFSGDWDNFLLGECVKIVGGGTPSTDIATYWDGNIDWYTPTEIGTSPYAYESERKISTIGLENSSATILPANKTLLFTSRASIGDAAILRNDGTTNQGFQSLVVDDTIDIYFLYSMSFQIKEYGLQHAAGSTFIEVSGRELKQMPVLFPAIEEQKKIGAFFKSFDRNIMSERKLISKLHALKQAYLSELFV